MEIYCTPISTKFRRVDTLPASFQREFTPGRDPLKWIAQLDR